MNAKPIINVTPLIDVLLVLLIIFMVITPIKPTDFKTRIPNEPNRNDPAIANPLTLVVALHSNAQLRLNDEGEYGNVQSPENLIKRLIEIFDERSKNGTFSQNLIDRNDLTYEQKIEKTVFIKAPRSMDYGSVAKVVDAVKVAGAEPISLQIDDLQ